MDNEVFSHKKILEISIFLHLFLFATKVTVRPLVDPKDCINSNPYFHPHFLELLKEVRILPS
jgi:hypothetical protein